MDLLDLVDAGCEGVIYLAVGWIMCVQAMMCGFLYKCLSRAGFASFDTLHVQYGVIVFCDHSW
jgi:hypothetical protein